MKKTIIKNSRIFLVLFLATVFSFTINAQDAELVEETNEALNEMFEKVPELSGKISAAYGHAVIPKITKAGIGIGGAGGKGIVYKGGAISGTTKMGQATIGLQLGGQQYSELILFENKTTYDNFISGKFKFSAQVSAVALAAGVSLDAPYKNGVLIYTLAQGGLMYEASVGGQKFSFEEK